MAIAVLAALLQLAWTGYVWIACAVAFCVCVVTYENVKCPRCDERILDTTGFLPPRNLYDDLRQCPHCGASFDDP